MWSTAPRKGGEVLPSPAAAALLPGTVSLRLGPAEAVGGGSRTALCLLLARVHICPAGDFGMSSS